VIFSCDRCGRRYSVPDERVQGRTFRVTCKSCGNVILVKPGAPAREAAPVPAAAPHPPPAPVASAGPARAERTITGPLVHVSGLGSAPVREHDSSRALTAAEMAWMSDDEGRPAAPPPEPGPEASEDVSVEEEVPAPPARSGHAGPGIARAVLAAVLLGLVAAAVVGFFVWPGWRATPPPPKVAVAPAPPPAPAPDAQPVSPAPPPVAAAPEPASAPALVEPAPAPTVGPGARFEPGTVTIGKVRRKEAPKLNRKDRKLLDLLARKHDQAAPPGPVEKLELDTARSLEPAAVERVIEESQGAFSGCVTRSAKATGLPNSRRATLLLTVARTGEVSTAWVAEAEVSRTGLGRCLVGAARRLVFPAFEGGPVDVSVPLTLEAR
jgi:predicted Zn finger-like uncharacterized protein